MSENNAAGRMMDDLWQYMKLGLICEELPTMSVLLKEIEDNGGTDAALAELRSRQQEKYHNDLVWRYPISQGNSAGGFIMPVREGILWIPFNEMEKEAGEILLTDEAELLDEETCEVMANSLSHYAGELCDVLRQCARICWQHEHGKVTKMLELGEFEMSSGRMAVSDPCYDVDVWCRGELENVMNGTWLASAVEMYTGRWGRRIARLIAVHEHYADEKMDRGQRVGFEVGVDSGQAGLFDVLHYRDDVIMRAMTDECLICKAQLEYLEADVLMECAICHRKESSKTRCVNGHYVCNDCHMAGMDAIMWT